jgi:hypothetical protein
MGKVAGGTKVTFHDCISRKLSLKSASDVMLI